MFVTGAVILWQQDGWMQIGWMRAYEKVEDDQAKFGLKEAAIGITSTVFSCQCSEIEE